MPCCGRRRSRVVAGYEDIQKTHPHLIQFDVHTATECTWSLTNQPPTSTHAVPGRVKERSPPTINNSIRPPSAANKFANYTEKWQELLNYVIILKLSRRSIGPVRHRIASIGLAWHDSPLWSHLGWFPAFLRLNCFLKLWVMYFSDHLSSVSWTCRWLMNILS